MNNGYKNHEGEIHGDMKIIKDYGAKHGKGRKVRIKCLECGREKDISFQRIKENYGIEHKSCGHGLKTKNKKFHRVWMHMIQRVSDENNKYYGGRGIKVCERWCLFINFYDDMFESFIEHLEKYGVRNTTLDRIDVNGDYCKDNCRWATMKEQANNRRPRGGE